MNWVSESYDCLLMGRFEQDEEYSEEEYSMSCVAAALAQEAEAGLLRLVEIEVQLS